MEQHISTLLRGHHQAKHILYNTLKEYIKCRFRIDISLLQQEYFPFYIKSMG